MLSPKMGFVAVASPLEAGFDVAEERMKKAVESLKKHIQVVFIERVVANRADGVNALKKLRKEDVDLLGVMACTWLHDDVILNIIYGLGVPVVLWALPYPETVSMGCVQHIASVLKANGIYYKYVYGKETDNELAEKIAPIAKVAMLAKELRGLRVGQIGSRPMWRVTGPTDMTFDEINLSHTVGSQVVHIETSELLSTIGEVSDDEAKDVLENMRKAGKLNVKVDVKEVALLKAIKSYIALKKIVDKYSLDAVTVQCYPEYAGLVCFAFSQLGEERIAVGCEGDVISSILIYVLQKLTGKPATVTEPVSIEEDKGTIILRHCGAAAPSFAHLEEIHLAPVSPEEGVMVQFPVKPAPATVACIWGKEKLNIFIASAKTMKIDIDDWAKMGKAFLARIKLMNLEEENIKRILDKIIQEKAIDHHWVLVLNDVKEELTELARILKMNVVKL